MSNEFELVGTQILQNGEPFALKAIVRMLNNKTALASDLLDRLAKMEKENEKLLKENAVLHKEKMKYKRQVESE